MRRLTPFAAMAACILSPGILADVALVSPLEPYRVLIEAGIGMPGDKSYTLVNTSTSWLYWRASSARGRALCKPAVGWIPPSSSQTILICPSPSMLYAYPGDYADQVSLYFDPRVLGDVNGDGVVDGIDMLAIAQAFGGREDTCDFDHDGVVGIWDVLQVVDHFGMRFGGTSI
jgi:hypothetical protein